MYIISFFTTRVVNSTWYYTALHGFWSQPDSLLIYNNNNNNSYLLTVNPYNIARLLWYLYNIVRLIVSYLPNVNRILYTSRPFQKVYNLFSNSRYNYFSTDILSFVISLSVCRFKVFFRQPIYYNPYNYKRYWDIKNRHRSGNAVWYTLLHWFYNNNLVYFQLTYL